MTQKASVTLVGCPDQETAQKIATQLIEKRLAACVHINGPIQSLYRWEGRVETGSEWQLWIKSKTGLGIEISHEICQLHPFEVPQIVSMPIADGYPPYLSWVEHETKSV